MNTLNFTATATARIQKILQQNPNKIMRIAVEKSGCSGWRYVVETVDQTQPTDIPIQADIATVYLDAKSQSFLQGSILDCVEKQLGLWQWEFNNPQAANSCGCGESFNLKDSI